MNIPWGRMLILSGFVYLFFVFLALAYSNKVMFPIPPVSYEKTEKIHFLGLASGIEVAICRFGELENPTRTILYSHGNAEDMGSHHEIFSFWHERKWEFIAYDYPGYGLSEGKPSEQNCLEAIDAIYQYATGELQRSPDRILVWGRSLGTGPSCYLASKEKVGGLILETPFLSAFRTITEIPVLPWDYFRNLVYAESISCPSLIIHGKWDEIVPFRHGKKLHQTLPHPKTFMQIEEANHNNIREVGGQKYERGIIEFIQNLDS